MSRLMAVLVSGDSLYITWEEEHGIDTPDTEHDGTSARKQAARLLLVMAAISKAEIWLLFCLKTVCCTLGSWWPTSRLVTAWIWARLVPSWYQSINTDHSVPDCGFEGLKYNLGH